MLENELPLAAHTLVLSGRISFELMQKALAAGIIVVWKACSPCDTWALHLRRSLTAAFAAVSSGLCRPGCVGRVASVGLVLGPVAHELQDLDRRVARDDPVPPAVRPRSG